MFNHEDRRINWRFYPVFLLILLIIGTVGLLLLLDYIDDNGYFESPERVEQLPLLPLEGEEEESGPDEVNKTLMLLLMEGGEY